MKNSYFALLLPLLILITAAWACNASSANLASVKTGKDKDVTQPTSTFKAGDTIYANAAVANNAGKVTVKIYITVDDAPGMTKGDTIPNSEASRDVDGDGTVKYDFPTLATTKGGKFNIVVDMLQGSEKKDSKSASFSV
ncbi:MAG: hypothetical protein JO314_06445, partial [Acidobacteria bacterium]|nr:hypothetical protein [Acidobacteriota bacterium]